MTLYWNSGNFSETNKQSRIYWRLSMSFSMKNEHEISKSQQKLHKIFHFFVHVLFFFGFLLRIRFVFNVKIYEEKKTPLLMKRHKICDKNSSSQIDKSIVWDCVNKKVRRERERSRNFARTKQKRRQRWSKIDARPLTDWLESIV